MGTGRPVTGPRPRTSDQTPGSAGRSIHPRCRPGTPATARRPRGTALATRPRPRAGCRPVGLVGSRNHHRRRDTCRRPAVSPRPRPRSRPRSRQRRRAWSHRRRPVRCHRRPRRRHPTCDANRYRPRPPSPAGPVPECPQRARECPRRARGCRRWAGFLRRACRCSGRGGREHRARRSVVPPVLLEAVRPLPPGRRPAAARFASRPVPASGPVANCRRCRRPRG